MHVSNSGAAVSLADVYAPPGYGPLAYNIFSAIPEMYIMPVSIKSSQEIEKMRVAGRLASEVLDYITPFVQAGITTAEIDQLCHNYMVDVQQCIPAPLD